MIIKDYLKGRERKERRKEFSNNYYYILDKLINKEQIKNYILKMEDEE